MGKKTTATNATDSGMRLSSHPRARRHIAKAKAWGGISAFAAVAVFSYRAGLPVADLLLRSTIAGAVGLVLAWALTLTVWRHLALAQIEGLRRELIDEMLARRAHDDGHRAELEQRALQTASEARTRAPDRLLEQ